ncbi:hypothetical protein [Treponema pectinovorum]|uniref:hypothetical protein n=1 Tax=Treponema pectinovorum TaxID=164 RepID=UPI0011F3CEA9|nr:hypothetical protein [Treponema pectinovorum]
MNDVNDVFFILGTLSYMVYSWIAIYVLKYTERLRTIIIYVIVSIVFLVICIICFSKVKSQILYDTTKTCTFQENKDTSIPYKYKIKEITVKEYRDKSLITNDWKEDSQQFKKEEKIIYSNELPNEKYILVKQENKMKKTNISVPDFSDSKRNKRKIRLFLF